MDITIHLKLHAQNLLRMFSKTVSHKMNPVSNSNVIFTEYSVKCAIPQLQLQLQAMKEYNKDDEKEKIDCKGPELESAL